MSGTIDSTVHELLDGYGLKELYKATGGPWGGIEVDKAFEHMLSTLIGGEEVYKTFKRECADDHLLMMWRFEITKRSINPTGETKTVIILPMCYRTLLEGTGEHLKQRIAGSVYKDDIKVKLEKIILSAGLSRSFFEEVVKRVVAHVTELLDKRELDGVDTLLMVGGFSESKMLRHALKASLDINFLFPDDGELAIVKGAVLFGYQSPHKHERIARYTYGVKTARRFLRGVHDAAKCRIFLLNEFNMCDNLFRKFVEEGTLLRYGEVHGEHEFTPVTETSRGVYVFVYACTDRFPEYVTDEECEMVSTVRLKLLNTKVRLEERIITIAFSFSGTEITVTAREKLSGNKVQTTVVFL